MPLLFPREEIVGFVPGKGKLVEVTESGTGSSFALELNVKRLINVSLGPKYKAPLKYAGAAQTPNAPNTPGIFWYTTSPAGLYRPKLSLLRRYIVGSLPVATTKW